MHLYYLFLTETLCLPSESYHLLILLSKQEMQKATSGFLIFIASHHDT